jgi:exopolysaccharide biosynthesis protein
LSLADYVSRSGAFAGINGSYFCPASYPSCSDKKNSFDLLAMNKNKTYFNSDNNVYSNNPAVIFLGGSVRFVGAASQWGRDQGIDGMLSNYPLLVSGSNVVFGGDGDPKKGSKGNRSFVANKGNTVYIGVVHGATVAEAAIVLKALGMENAMNLDSGGSTALWANGYKVGPGRAIPNAILFVRK